MSFLSGYDSESVGFESVNCEKKPEKTISTQTTEFSESGAASQTNMSSDVGCSVTFTDLDSGKDVIMEFPPPGLNDFLKRVVPGMLEQLDQNEKEIFYDSSDSEEDETVIAKLFQEIRIKTDLSIGAGDSVSSSVLGVTWSSAGNSLAVSIGAAQHENWCQHDGLIRIYTAKHSEGDKLVHSLDIAKKNCITVLKYNPSVAALLAYGTTTGEVVLCHLRDSISGLLDQEMQLTSPAGCHGSKRVSFLVWADIPLANIFLIQQIKSTGKRRAASDQILISSGSDGTINVWQVNVNSKTFSNVITYNINGARKMIAADITCFDFTKSFPLQPHHDKTEDDIFVVGTKSGKLYLCKTKHCKPILNSNMVDPVHDILEGHSTCILDIAFSFQRPWIFVSVSMDSELRIYDVNQTSPLKVLCIDVPISCLSLVPNNPSLAIVGLSDAENKELLRVYNVCNGSIVPIDGLKGNRGSITSIAVRQTNTCRVAAGDSDGTVRIWDLPLRRIKISSDDLEF